MLEQRIREWLGQHFGKSATWTIKTYVKKSFSAGRERWILQALDPATDRRVALKTNSTKKSNRAEYEALRSLREQMPDSVAPLHLAPDGLFFALEWIDAPLLSDRMSGPDRPAAIERAGDWLRRLHDSTGGRSWAPSMKKGLQVPLWGGFGPAGGATARLRERRRAVSFKNGPVAMLHGDYYPGNLFDTGDRLLGFDRMTDEYGIKYLDAAKFLVNIMSRRKNALRLGQELPGTAETDRQHFFQGYGPLPGADLAVFDVVEDIIVYKKWRQHVRANKVSFDDEMRQRGLLEPVVPVVHPGRLVVGASGPPTWTTDYQPPRRGALLGGFRPAVQQ
jgi:hypothetical protein